MNVWLVSPAWQRYGVTRLALAQRRWLCDRLSARGWDAQAVIVADDANLDIAREYGFDIVELGNERLGDRFNAGIEYACRQGADYVIHVGSDDWVHPDFFDPLPLADAEEEWPTPERPFIVSTPGPVCLAAGRITIVDLPTARVRQLTTARRRLIPWAIPRALLEPSGFRPIAGHLQRGIDGALERGIPRAEWRTHDPHPYLLVDWKTGDNLTPFTQFESSDRGDFGGLVDFYPSHLLDMASRLIGGPTSGE